MYSEALIQMDKNTANYMIEEMQKEVDELAAEVAEKQRELAERKHELAESKHELAEKNNELAKQAAYIKELEAKLGIQNK